MLSVGRVQTPVLGLIVRRDLEIEHFQPKDFFEVLAWINPETKEEKTLEKSTALFSALWQPSKACEDYQDDDGRVLSKGLAEKCCKTHHKSTSRSNRIQRRSRKRNSTLALFPFCVTN